MNIFDLHNDIITANLADFEIRSRIEKEKEKGNEIVYAIWTTLLDRDEFINKTIYISKLNLLSSIEDAQIVSDDFELALISHPKYCSLTWNLDNSLGGGAYGKSSLTDKGKHFIEFLSKNNIALDLSHLNEQTFWQAIGIAERVVASHSAFGALNEHKRNLNDWQIEAIINKNGIIGLTPVPDFIKNKDKAGYFEAVDYFLREFGCDNIAIGSDFYGSEGISGLRNYDEIIQEIGLFINDESVADKVLFKNAQRFFE